MRNLTSLFFSTCLLLSCTFSAVGQTTVNATVTDEISDKGLKNVAIQLKSSPNSNGTITNRKGDFEIVAASASDTLVISHIGYETKEIAISRVPAQIILMRLSTNLSEVEVKSKKELFPNMTGFPTSKPSAPRQNSNASLLGTINVIPGILFDERGQGGSRRLSIRGSSLRAPFGVRNVKMYWNNIPMTSPDGSTPLELIDPAMTGRMDIIKGPVANIYGAVNGGTLKFYTKGFSPASEKMLRLNTTIGDFGLQRNNVQFFYNTNQFKADIFYSRQQYGGYRQQEFNNKDQLVFNFSYFKSNHVFSLFGNYYDGQWGLPGAIDSAEMANDPTQANVFAIENNTHVQRKRFRLGFRHRMRITDNLTLSTALYGNSTTKTNPYGSSAFYNGYKDEEAQGFGGRTELIWKRDWKGFSSRVYFGGEFQQEDNHLVESANDSGQPSTLLYQNSETVSTNAFAFAQADLKYNKTRTTLTIAANYGQLSYDHTDRLETDLIDFSGTRNFSPQFLPRIGLLQPVINKRLTLYGDLSFGQSAPTLWETLQSNGAMNTNLQAENSTVIELGAKSTLLNYKLSLDINVYQMELDNAIVSAVDSTGLVSFHNSGALSQKGFEASAHYTFISDRNRKVSLLRLWSTFTWQDFRFTDYMKNGEDFSDNLLPGSANILVNAGINVGLQKGFYLNASTRFVGEMAIDDANTVFSDPYLFVQSRAGYRWRIKEKISCEIYGGVNNLLDETYSSFLQINGFGGRYYNPAAARNFYGGAQVNFRF